MSLPPAEPSDVPASNGGLSNLSRADRSARPSASRWPVAVALIAVLGLFAVFSGIESGDELSGTVSAQEKEKPSRKTDKKKKAAVPTTQIDLKASELSETFVKEAQQLASEYYEAGALDKSKSLLEAVLKLKPDAKEIELQIKKIDEDVLSANELEADVNAAKGWEWSGVSVIEDKPFRIQAEGVYRFMVNTTVGPAGFPEKDKELTTEMVSRAPCGALVGVVLKDDGKQGQPFFIGNGGDFRLKESGKLFLRVNSPPDSKHNGKISVKFSGFVVKSGK